MAKNDKGFSAELLDQLLAGRDPQSVLDSGGLIGDRTCLKFCVRGVGFTLRAL